MQRICISGAVWFVETNGRGAGRQRQSPLLVVNRDDIAKRTGCSLCHGGSFSAHLVAFSHHQFSQIRGRQPYLFVRKILYVIGTGTASSARAHHVHRIAPMGARVLIIGIWY
jgi:hypothetical protein